MDRQFDVKTGEWSEANATVPTVDPVEEITQARANASMPRSTFILAALDGGILTEADAEQAVNGWPTSWDAFFDGKPARGRIEAKARWVETSVVRRNAALIAQLAAFKGLTDEQVDGLFGITSQP